jgi:hypothetical protein
VPAWAATPSRMLFGITDGSGETVAIEAGVHWLLTPISGSNEHFISTSLAWHGRLMVLSMGLLMPPLVIVARYFKVTRNQDWPRQLDNPFWFVTHRRWGYATSAILLLGLIFGLIAGGWVAPWHSFHAALGWAVVVLVLVQMVNAWLRGTHGGPVDPFTRKRRPPEQWTGDHFSMTRRRIIFEYVHKYAGYALLLLVVGAIPTGLIAADAPRWMPILMGIWWVAMLGLFARLQTAGKCIDTYQAIWGLDPSLPGNRRRPIGLGITRTKAEVRSNEN